MLLLYGSIAGSILSFFGTSLIADRQAYAEGQRGLERPAITRTYANSDLEKQVSQYEFKK